jgi:hypothetical protein
MSKKRKTNLQLSGFKEAVDDGTEELTLKVKSKVRCHILGLTAVGYGNPGCSKVG